MSLDNTHWQRTIDTQAAVEALVEKSWLNHPQEQTAAAMRHAKPTVPTTI
jgi:hypothetical protein